MSVYPILLSVYLTLAGEPIPTLPLSNVVSISYIRQSHSLPPPSDDGQACLPRDSVQINALSARRIATCSSLTQNSIIYDKIAPTSILNLSSITELLNRTEKDDYSFEPGGTIWGDDWTIKIEITVLDQTIVIQGFRHDKNLPESVQDLINHLDLFVQTTFS